jgi:hypothetical protein
MKTVTITEEQLRTALGRSGQSPLADNLVRNLFGAKTDVNVLHDIAMLRHCLVELSAEVRDLRNDMIYSGKVNRKPKHKK